MYDNIKRQQFLRLLMFYGVTIRPLQYLTEHPEAYDHLLIGNFGQSVQIREEAIAMGVDPTKIMTPYDVFAV